MSANSQVDVEGRSSLNGGAPSAAGELRRESTVGDNSPAGAVSAVPTGSSWRRGGVMFLVFAFTIIVSVLAIGSGRYGVSPVNVIRIVAHGVGDLFGVNEALGFAATWQPEEGTVVLAVRLPRILLALTIGGGLSVAGAALQALFHNPLVSPDVIGVSSGASFGGVLVIAFGVGSFGILTGAFAGGVVAVSIVLLFGALRSSSMILTIVLAGIVTSSFFSALVSLITYLADPYSTLPSITFWLMGSLASASYNKLWITLIPVALGFVVVYVLRWRINILALGDEDAIALGVKPARLRYLLILCVALITASTVAVAGVIGWIGLVIPHLVRLLIGTDYRQVIPGSLVLGGGFLVMIDTFARTISPGEIPLGVVTALIGAPFFGYLLLRNRNQELSHA